MKNATDAASGFVRWLDEEVAKLTADNSIDVHIDQLCGSGLSPHAQIEASSQLFGWVLTNLEQRLAGRVVMLMVPLVNSPALDMESPPWVALKSQLSKTPPSIYVMEASAYLQQDSVTRFIVPIDVPSYLRPSVAAHYQCWRYLDDPEDEGWARDVRLVSFRPVRQ